MYKNGNFGNWKTANKGKLCNPKSKYYLGRVFGGKVYVCNQEYKQGEASCLKQTILTDKEMYTRELLNAPMRVHCRSATHSYDFIFRLLEMQQIKTIL